MTDPLAQDLLDARTRSLALAADLTDAQWLGPRLAIVNPLLWELGHLGWFQEHWTLRHALGRAPLLAQGDALYDSAKVAHDTRWDLPLLPRAQVLEYLERTLAESLRALEGAPPARRYFHELALYHEDMHGEAFTSTRQTLGYPAPSFSPAPAGPVSKGAAPPAAQARAGDAGGPLPGFARITGARFLLGARPGTGFVFDNEKWAHEVEVRTFELARAPVTNAEFAAFVLDGGYADERLWSAEGWRWRSASAAAQPAYWTREGDGFRVRRYDALEELAPHQPVVHVCWHEADAYCRWAGLRLPTEPEWELAAAGLEGRRFPWGDEPPSPARANLDARAGGPVDVGCHAAGDSPQGCRQLIGNVWEWTASDFQPYPGFEIDPYREYSEPWFHSPHKVLRGGCWATRARLLRNTWRNFYPPDRRDVLACFRTARDAG